MPRGTWAGLLTLGDIQSYDSLVCHHSANVSGREFLIDVYFLHGFFFFLSKLQDECVTEQKPTSSTSANNMENSHGNIVVNGLQPLPPLWGDLHL